MRLISRRLTREARAGEAVHHWCPAWARRPPGRRATGQAIGHRTRGRGRRARSSTARTSSACSVTRARSPLLGLVLQLASSSGPARPTAAACRRTRAGYVTTQLSTTWSMKQDLDAFLAEDLEMGAARGGREDSTRRCSRSLLALLHPADVSPGARVGPRRSATGRREPEQLGDLVHGGVVVGHPLLRTVPNSFQNVRVLPAVRARSLSAAQDALDRAVRMLSMTRVFWRTSRDTFSGRSLSGRCPDEAQVVGQELLGVVHDEDAAHVELDAVRRDRRRRSYGAREGRRAAACTRTCPPSCCGCASAGLEVVRDVLGELVYSSSLISFLEPGPQRRCAVDDLLPTFLLDSAPASLSPSATSTGMAMGRLIVGVLADDRAQAYPASTLVLALRQVEDDLGPSARPGDIPDRSRRDRRTPSERRLRRSPPGGCEGDPVGDDERRVEAHAELADQAWRPSAGRR